MRVPFARRRSEQCLDRACLDVEQTVSRVAKVVLHASALADRMDRGANGSGDEARERVRVLRDAAEAGRRTLSQVGLGAASGAVPVRGGHRTSRPVVVPAPRSR